MSFNRVDLPSTSPSDIDVFLRRLSRWYLVLMLLCALTLGGNVTWAWVTLQSGQNALLMSQADEVAKTWRNLILDYGSLAGRFAHGNDAPADPTSRIRWRDVYGVVSIHTTPGESPVRSAQPSFAVSTGKPSPIIFFRGLGTERISPSTGLPAVHFSLTYRARIVARPVWRLTSNLSTCLRAYAPRPTRQIADGILLNTRCST